MCFSLIRTKYYNGRFERARKGSQISHARTSPRAFKNSPQTPEINRELRRAPRAASRALIVDQPLLPTGRTTVDRATTKSDDYITRSTLSTSFTRRNETPGSGSSVTSQSWPLIAQSKAPRIALLLAPQRLGLTQLALITNVTHRVPIQPFHFRSGQGSKDPSPPFSNFTSLRLLIPLAHF